MDRPDLDYAGLFDASPNPYLVLDRDLNIVGANRAYLDSTKRELADIVGRWAWDAFPTDAETLRQSVESFERVIRTRRPDIMALLRFDVPRPRSAGGGFEERYWSITHTPVLDAAGEVALVLQHPIDVTELQRLREASREKDTADLPELAPAHSGIFERAQAVHEANLSLLAQTERLELLFEQAPGFMAELRGPEHRIASHNEAYRALNGYRELLGLTMREAVPEADAQGFIALLDHVFASGKPHVGRATRLSIERSRGSPPESVYIDFVFQPVRSANGRVEGIFVQGHDVTEQQHAIAALREADARKDEFLATLAHELRNPLAPLRNVASLLKRSGPTPAQQPLIEIMERQVGQLRRLVEDLLEISRITHGKITLKREPMRVGSAVYAALEAIQPHVDQRHQVLEARVGSSALVDIDAARITQVVTNLLNNASKFTPEGGKIALEAFDEADAVTVRVCDEGIGIAPEVLPRVFELFAQGSSTTADQAQGGLGIGLSLVKRLVEMHGGSVQARSEGLGKGACFVVRLPCRT